MKFTFKLERQIDDKMKIAFLTMLLIMIIIARDSKQLNCFCNSCETNECEIDNNNSKCFKSVTRVEENNTYFFEISYGCLSGSGDNIGIFQCETNSKLFNEPTFVSCCKNNSFCNRDLRDPNISDDPRWGVFDEKQEYIYICSFHIYICRFKESDIPFFVCLFVWQLICQMMRPLYRCSAPHNEGKKLRCT